MTWFVSVPRLRVNVDVDLNAMNWMPRGSTGVLMDFMGAIRSRAVARENVGRKDFIAGRKMLGFPVGCEWKSEYSRCVPDCQFPRPDD